MIVSGLLTDGMHQALVEDGGLTPEIEELARKRTRSVVSALEEIAHATVFLPRQAKWITDSC